jgi:hypothetical protein
MQSDEEMIGEFATIGRHLICHPRSPWTRRDNRLFEMPELNRVPQNPKLDELSGLGVAASFAISIEICTNSRINLSGLPMPIDLKNLFREWSERRVDFVSFRKRR